MMDVDHLAVNASVFNVSIIELKIFSPSAEPSNCSLERSGWGIMPSTLRFALRIPAMLPSDPLGLPVPSTVPPGAQ